MTDTPASAPASASFVQGPLPLEEVLAADPIADDGTGADPTGSAYIAAREAAIARVHSWCTIVDAYRSTAAAIRSRAEHEHPDVAWAFRDLADDWERTAHVAVQRGPDAVHPLTVDPTVDGAR